MEFLIKHQFPTNQEFNKLFESVGWGNRDDDKIDMHRKTSTFAVSIYEQDSIIAMARVVGDGSYFTVYDVVVHKNYQGKGLGSMLMKEIVDWFNNLADDDTYLYLGASAGKEKFYEKFGFKVRPYDGIGAGMKFDPN